MRLRLLFRKAVEQLGFITQERPVKGSVRRTPSGGSTYVRPHTVHRQMRPAPMATAQEADHQRKTAVVLAAKRLKAEHGWHHPVLWEEGDYRQVLASLGEATGYHPAGSKNLKEYLAHRLAMIGLHQIKRDADGMPVFGAHGQITPTGGDDELKRAIWRAASIPDDEDGSHTENAGLYKSVPAHQEPWIGVDLDGTLAYYDGDASRIGNPIPRMLERVQRWLREGKRVKIMTSRAVDQEGINQVRAWLHEHGVGDLEVTCQKDPGMVALWDDRAVGVHRNTGLRKSHVRSYTKQDGTVVREHERHGDPTGYSIMDNVLDAHHGQIDGELVVTDQRTKKVVGVLSYSLFEGTYHIQHIEVLPDHRRKGIGTALVRRLQAEGEAISWGMTTPDGSKLKESMERSERIAKGIRGGGHPIGYKTEFQGLPITVEQRKGSIRRWTDSVTGEEGETKFEYPYGYIRLTQGVDGDHVDCFLGPNPNATHAYVIHQMKRPDFTEYDEDKCMLGFDSADEAKAAYLRHYNNPKFLGSMHTMPMAEFIRKVRATKDKPGMIKGAFRLLMRFGKASCSPGDNCRWITVHAHGSGEGQPILIRESKNSPGTYHVVGGGGGRRQAQLSQTHERQIGRRVPQASRGPREREEGCGQRAGQGR